MNVLFLTLVDIISINERGIYQDLLREFIKNSHNIYVVSPSERRYGKETTVIENDHCKILNVKTGNIQKTNLVEKGISTLLIEHQFVSAIKKYYSNIEFDLVMYSTPPITFVKSIKYLKRKHNAKTYLLLRDIFPQNAVDLKMFSPKGLIHRYFRNKEKKLYRISDWIGCMSQANVDYLIKHNPYIDASKIHVSPNSIEPIEIIVDKASRAKTRQKYNIPLETKVYIYGGNLGKPQDIPFVVECLKQNQNKADRYFVVCGSGTDYHILKTYVDEYKPDNVKLMESLPKNEYDELIGCCDIGLIFLDKRFTIPNFPSRILSYMENTMPVIACTDLSTDMGQVIVDGNFGWWCESDDASKFTQIVDNITDEDVTNKGNSARKYLETNYTAEKNHEIIIKNITEDNRKLNDVQG